MYIQPHTEVAAVESFALLVSVSGGNGLNDGGQDNGSQTAQAPKRRIFF